MFDLATSEPIDLTDVRSYLSMEDDDIGDDPILEESIAFCRGRLEQVLPYHLAEREVRVQEPLHSWSGHEEIPLKGPILEVSEVSVMLADGTLLVCPQQAWFVFGDILHLEVREALEPADIIHPAIGVIVTYRAGAHVPPVVKNALLMMVRNRYERRDEDPLTDAVMSSIYAEMRPNI